jgi:hypothetical protein
VVLAWNRRIWLLALIGAVLIVGACGGQEQQSAETAPNAQLAPGEVPLSLEDRVEFAKPRYEGLPDNYPSDVPHYPGVTVTHVKASSDGGLSVGMTSTDDFEKVASFFADTFAAEGWGTDISDTPNGRAIFADKGNRNATAMLTRIGDITSIDVIVIQLN